MGRDEGRERLGDTSPTRIIVGASSQSYPGWLQTQHDELDITRLSAWTAQFPTGTLTHILAGHVWEHLLLEEARLAAYHCFSILAPGGRVRCAVPDGNVLDAEYQQIVQVGGPGPPDYPAASQGYLQVGDAHRGL